MTQAKPSSRRCAIYTRKSSEEGLEQDFNSLHAQREACEAFIRSQRGEGWRGVPTAYDDGGFSGGTMDRPGLQRLLTDIAEGLIDVVVVYKVDRLTRSLTDFAKMVELFDARGVSFVAVTQQFNTTTSMGRLTLNVLLSFAQFEREVTGERIRDKIAASKRKGMWMGGHAPLGYEAHERKLVVNAEEAQTVRRIFARYLALGCVRRLKEELDRQGIRSKVRRRKDGRASGGQPLSRGALYALLANLLYIGEVRHKGVRHPGQHAPILERALWEAVQQQLRDHAAKPRGSLHKGAPSPLAGKLFDETGERLMPSHTAKRGRRYRYYVSRRLATGTAGATEHGWRLPAREIERSVAAAAGAILDDRGALAGTLQEAGIATERIPAFLEAAQASRRCLLSETDRGPALAALVDRVELQRDGIRLTLALARLEDPPNASVPTLSRRVPMRMKRRGIERRLVIEGAASPAPKADPALLKAVARAHRWFEAFATGQAASLAEIAARAGVTARYVRRLLPLAFLAPDIVEIIAEGRQPPDLTAESLIRRVDLPLEWAKQKRTLGIE